MFGGGTVIDLLILNYNRKRRRRLLMLQLILISIVGAIAGGLALNEAGVVIGFILGWLTVGFLRLRKKIGILENRLSLVETQPAAVTTVAGTAVDNRTAPVEEHPIPEVPPPVPEADKPLKTPQAKNVQTINTPPPLTADATNRNHKPSSAPKTELSAEDGNAGSDIFEVLKRWVTGGNPVVRIGVVIMFFGVGFLMKYAAGHGMLPIELRLAGSVLAGMTMIGIGWRFRERRKNYATVLQGGGVGILYLTLFAAARLYGLIRLETAFAVMVVLVILTGVLAVLQGSRSLAVFGTVGGFLAPILSSTGEGSHVMLFTYYALLNAGVLGVAWFKSWRILNITGFLFTFSIGLVWGLQFYRPHYFATTEPFLILFFLMYVTISILFAFRQPVRFRGLVDNTLVFGLPVAAFGLQISLVRFSMSDLALSAFVLGIFYLLLSGTLKWKAPKVMGLLSEAFLANGVVFTSLAIPLAMDANWTALAWALEGAALIWIGVRQNRCLPRLFGILLQFGAGLVLWFTLNSIPQWMASSTGIWFEGGILSLAGLFSAFYLEKYRVEFHRFEKPMFIPVLAWGLMWWLTVGFREIAVHVPIHHAPAVRLAFVAVSACCMGALSHRLNWRSIGFPTLGLLPVMGLAAMLCLSRSAILHPFAGYGWLAWTVAFGIQVYLLRFFETRYPTAVTRGWHLGTFLLALIIVTWEVGFAVFLFTRGSQLWTYLVAGVLPAMIMLAVILQGYRISWPVKRFLNEYNVFGPALICIYLTFWSLVSTTMPGAFSAVGYIPILNPLDIGQLVVLSAVVTWAVRFSRQPNRLQEHIPASVLVAFPAAAAFTWLNAMAARTVHHWGVVPFTLDALHHSVLFHTVISVLWGVTALSAMIWANRSRLRWLWFSGAGLLGLEVIKLFLVDLSGTGSVARIVSFLAVGALMLVIGFFSPLPPAQKKTPVRAGVVRRVRADNFLDTSQANH